MTPCVCSHHKELNWHLVQPLPLPFDMRVQPVQTFANDQASADETSMGPRAGEQIRRFSRAAQRLVVLQLPIQEDIIPATHEISGCVHLSQACAEVDRLPVVILRPVEELLLEGLRWPSHHEPVSLAKRQVSIGALQFAVSQGGQEKRTEPWSGDGLDSHHGG